MISKKYIWPIFGILVLAQLLVPIRMIWERESAIHKGEVLHLKTAPVDPADPFRGRYVRLNFEADHLKVRSQEHQLNQDQQVFVTYNKDTDGYHFISNISSVRPSYTDTYLQTTISHVGPDRIHLDIPFDRYYMQEFKAPVAEEVYREARRDTTITTYAKVNMYRGLGVLTDVMMGDVSLKDAARE